jgi:SAM-dependent MidA family methyltransferase
VTLRHRIEQEIRECGPMPFSRYMELCLYHPDLGYYSRNPEQFGKAGDFYTSSDVHAVFGRLLARQFEEMWRALGSPAQIEILEFGPGRGLFAQDVLDWSEKKFPEFFQALHYSLAESSTTLRQRLQGTLSGHMQRGKASLSALPQGLKPGTFADVCSTAEAMPSPNAVASRDGCLKPRGDTTTEKNLSAQPMAAPGSAIDNRASGKDATSEVPNGVSIPRALPPEAPVIVFANEFFDALPVEVLSPQGELRISQKDGRLCETWHPASAEELGFLDRYSVHPEAGERIEAPLIAQRYMSQIAAMVQRGFVVLIDYGYTRQEQLAGRHRGTIAAYRQHSADASPYQAPGEQDLTAHVNFTALAAVAEEQGMQAQPLLTQSQLLLGIGEPNQFADAFEQCRLPQERAKVALQLKHLVTPAGMGESFHVLLASKGIHTQTVKRLSGLTFGTSAHSVRVGVGTQQKLL